MTLARQVVLNPMVLSTLIGLGWAASGLSMPAPVGAYLHILTDALTATALFAIGLGLSVEGLVANLAKSAALTVMKLVVMPLIVLMLAIALRLPQLYAISAVVCAAVPTAKTVYILAGEYKCEEKLVSATVSMTTLFSIATLIGWMFTLVAMFPVSTFR